MRGCIVRCSSYTTQFDHRDVFPTIEGRPPSGEPRQRSVHTCTCDHERLSHFVARSRVVQKPIGTRSSPQSHVTIGIVCVSRWSDAVTGLASPAAPQRHTTLTVHGASQQIWTTDRFWIISVVSRRHPPCPLLPPKRPFAALPRSDALCRRAIRSPRRRGQGLELEC